MMIKFRLRRCSWPGCRRIAPFTYIVEPDHVRVAAACRKHRLEVQMAVRLQLRLHSSRWN
jgi:hypothetical protein